MRPPTLHSPLAVFAPFLLAACAATAGDRAPFPISTDRPSVSATQALVPAGRTLVESGAVVGEDGDERFRQAGEVVIRHGLSDQFELNVGLPSYRAVEQRTVTGSAFSQETRGLTDCLFALRAALYAPDAQSGLTPTLALLAGTTIPTGSEFGATRALPSATLIANWSLPRGFGFATNVGLVAVENGDPQPTATGVLSATVGARLGLFAEAALARSDASWGKTLSVFGATYLLTPRLQLDLAHRRRGPASAYRDVGIGLSVAR